MAIQDALSAVDAAPLLSAGIAACSSLRHSDVRPGDYLGSRNPWSLEALFVFNSRASSVTWSWQSGAAAGGRR